MGGKSQDSVKRHLRAIEPARKAFGASIPEAGQEQLRQPPAAHPLQNSYSRRVGSVSDCSQEHSSPPQGSRDPEKASSDHRPMQSHQLSSHCTKSAHFDEDEGGYEDGVDSPKRHAVWILVKLLKERVNPQVLTSATDIPLRSRTSARPSDSILHTCHGNPPPIAIPLLPPIEAKANQCTILPLPRATTQISTWLDLFFLRDRLHNIPNWWQHIHLGSGGHLCTGLRSVHDVRCMDRRGVLVLYCYTGQPRWQGREG